MVSGENIRKDKIICAIHADITASFQNRELTTISLLCKNYVSSKADHLNYFSKTFKTRKRQHSLIPSQSDNGCVWVAMILLLWLSVY